MRFWLPKQRCSACDTFVVGLRACWPHALFVNGPLSRNALPHSSVNTNKREKRRTTGFSVCLSAESDCGWLWFPVRKQQSRVQPFTNDCYYRNVGRGANFHLRGFSGGIAAPRQDRGDLQNTENILETKINGLDNQNEAVGGHVAHFVHFLMVIWAGGSSVE